MCGIAGVLLRNGDAQLQTVAEMCRRIRHRGPDDEGFHLDRECAIGMRRLCIIDLKTGHQPISNEDGSIWIVFNGEVYNFQELRAELTAQGHRFRTNTDTEALVHLYEQHGPAGVSRLRGMFAFAIWDSRQRRLFVARDRFGKKPLYYASVPGGFYFASELKSLRLPEIPLEIDRDALKLYLQFQYIPDPYTCFAAIRRLRPGFWMTVAADGTIQQEQYWRLPPPAAATTSSEDELAARIRSTFDDAVRMRMIADVPLGAFLSGGIDSGSVVASMAIQSREPVKTFSIGFDEAEFNELEYAGMVAKKYRTDHHEIVVRPDSVSLVHRLIRHFDEPFADPAAIPTFIVSEFAAQSVKVVLTGDGGDELFGGYDSFFEIQHRRRFDRVPLGVRALAARLADALPYTAYGKNYLRMMSRRTPLERYFESNYAPHFLRTQLLQPDWRLADEDDDFRRELHEFLLGPDSDVLLEAMYFEATTNLTGDMLVKVDRMSMAHSLEVRCPLLDHELAELAMAIPPSMKLRDGRGKYLFVRALGDRLPEALLHRPKMGFGVPLAAWFRGPLRPLLWDTLKSEACLSRNIVNPGFVHRLLKEHDSGRRDNSLWLWSLLMLELWFTQLAAQPVDEQRLQQA